MTHCILGASFFYKRHVDYVKYKGIFDELDLYADEIYEKLTLDINIEVALCFRLVGKVYSLEKQIIHKIKMNFDETNGYIKREGNTNVLRAEHMNSIALLLLHSDVVYSHLT